MPPTVTVYDVQVTPFYGRSIYRDGLSAAEEELAARIDAELSDTVARVEADIQEMQREQLVLESINRNLGVSNEQIAFIAERFPEYEDPEARNRRLAGLNEDIVRFNQARNGLIREAGSILMSAPEFNVQDFNPAIDEYTFYRPIVGPRQGVDRRRRGGSLLLSRDGASFGLHREYSRPDRRLPPYPDYHYRDSLFCRRPHRYRRGAGTGDDHHHPYKPAHTRSRGNTGHRGIRRSWNLTSSIPEHGTSFRGWRRRSTR